VTTHLAGTPIWINGRVIQRCLICGEKLCDSLNTMSPVEADGSAPVFPTWAVGAWVEFDRNRASLVAETERPFFAAEDLPEGCCLDLVE